MALPDDAGLIEQFEEFLREHCHNQIGEFVQDYPNKQRSLYLNWEDLNRYDSNIADDFIFCPDQMREYAEEALRRCDLPVDVKLDSANVRVEQISETTPLSELRSEHLGTLVEITGRIQKSSSRTSELAEGAWECQRCGTLTRIPYSPHTDGKSEPHECQGCERKGPFDLNRDQSEWTDHQSILVEQRTGSDTPETIVIELFDDIAGTATVGDQVRITGVLRREDMGEYNEGSLPDKYIEAYAVNYEPAIGIDISNADKDEILELSTDPDLYEKMIGSLAPTIYGYREEKLAILMQLFSGVTKELPDGSRIRGDIHTLLVGDPGTAKSALGDAARRLSPNGVRVSGAGRDTSPVGVTAAAVPTKSGSGSPWEIKGGAAVLADEGLLFVDDIGELSNEAKSALTSVLEKQAVDVAKAGKHKTLRARATVLAAANPKYGRFDEYEPIAEQIGLEPGLVSQFDLIFTVTDKPDAEKDRDLAEHIVESNFAGELHTQDSKIVSSNFTQEDIDAATEKIEPPIEADLLRKYIAFAKRECYPTMTEDAKEAIKEFYVNLRSQGEAEDAPVPVTARKLEALIRLAEASARIRLSDTVTTEDTDRVIQVVRTSLADVGMDPDTGNFDADAVESGTSKPSPELSENIKVIIREMQDDYKRGAPVEKVIDRATQAGISRSKTEHELQKLKTKGDVYEPQTDHLRIV
jgi:replicative DNA helicase Mcm